MQRSRFMTQPNERALLLLSSPPICARTLGSHTNPPNESSAACAIATAAAWSSVSCATGIPARARQSTQYQIPFGGASIGGAQQYVCLIESSQPSHNTVLVPHSSTGIHYYPILAQYKCTIPVSVLVVNTIASTSQSLPVQKVRTGTVLV